MERRGRSARYKRGEYKSGGGPKFRAGAPEAFHVTPHEAIEGFGGVQASVTGAGGFIGLAVCRRLAEAGAQVSGVDLDPARATAIEAAGATPVQADVTDRDTVAAAIADSEFVVHTAANVREWGPMRDFIRVNVGGTAAVLDAADEAARVVHLSSVVVYGYEDAAVQDEAAPRRAVGIPYVDTKSASDRLACDRGAVVIRPGDVYGPGSVPWVSRPIALMRRRLLAVPRDSVMLPIFVDDLVDAVIRGLTSGTPGAAYAVWDGSETSFGEYFDLLADAAGVPRPMRLPKPLLWLLGAGAEGAAMTIGREPLLGRHGATFISRTGSVSNRRARTELGWEPRTSLVEGVRKSADPGRGVA